MYNGIWYTLAGCFRLHQHTLRDCQQPVLRSRLYLFGIVKCPPRSAFCGGAAAAQRALPRERAPRGPGRRAAAVPRRWRPAGRTAARAGQGVVRNPSLTA